MPKAAASETHKVLARTIVQHLLDADIAPGAPVSEAGLAQAMGVSRSPIRGALQLLENQGIVERGDNRRLTLVRVPTADDPTLAESEDGGEAEGLYWRIASDRLAHRVNATIAEADMMRLYDVNRGLLRRAMRQITVEGWAEQLPTGVWRFLPLIDGPESYDESYRFRRAIEPAALLDPGFSLPASVANRLRREQTHLLTDNDAASPRQVFEHNSGFHLALMQASNNRFFADAALRVTRLRRVVGYVIALDHSRTAEQSAEHLTILSRIEDNDMASAARLMARHLKAGQRSKAALLADTRLTIAGPRSVELD